MIEQDVEIIAEGEATHELEEDTSKAETAELPPAQPSTLVRNMPLNADTLMAWATRLESEAERYTNYSPPQQSLNNAANLLRSAVGHVLTGKYTKAQA